MRIHGRVLVKGREDASHICPTTDGINFWSSGILQEQIGSVEDRQCLSHVLCQQDGGNKVVHLVTASKESMAVVKRFDSLDGTTYPRETKLHSRFHVTPPERSIRLHPGCRDIRNDHIGSNFSRQASGTKIPSAKATPLITLTTPLPHPHHAKCLSLSTSFCSLLCFLDTPLWIMRSCGSSGLSHKAVSNHCAEATVWSQL